MQLLVAAVVHFVAMASFRAGRLGGGARAQAAKADAEVMALGDKTRISPNVAETSGLVTKCLHLWSQGDLPATTVQQLSLLAILDGAENQELARVAAIGTCGHWPANCTRDLKTMFCKTLCMCQPTLVKTFFRDPKISRTVEETMALFNPAEFMHCLSSHIEFHSFFGTAEIRRFWDQVEASHSPQLQGHPLTLQPNWRDLTIPLWFHGDGVEFHERDSIMAYSFGSILSLLHALDSSCLMSANAKTCTVQESAVCPGTWKTPWKHFCHGFGDLAAGVFSELDADGNPHPLAGQKIHPAGYRAYIWTIEGDHEFFSNNLKLPHWRCHKMCWDCNADVTTDTTWKNMSAPQWTLFTAEQHKARAPSHPVFTCPGVSTMMVCHDSLHVMYCHGILNRLFGSILYLWCYDGSGIRQAVSPADRLALVFDKIQEWYHKTDSDSRTRLANLRLSMFVSTERPHAEFPALTTKGGETKHLLPAMLWVAGLLNDDSEVHSHILIALAAINKFVFIVDHTDWVPTEREATRLLKYAERFLGAYMWLSSWAESQDKLLFPLVPKFHTFHHLAIKAKHLSPKYCWCFKAEDYVGKISKIAASAVFGVKSTKLSIKLLEKYSYMMHFRITRPLVDAL